VPGKASRKFWSFSFVETDASNLEGRRIRTDESGSAQMVFYTQLYLYIDV